MLVLREKLEKLESDSSIVCWFRKNLNLCTFPDQQDQGGVTIILIIVLHIILDQINIMRIVWIIELERSQRTAAI